MKKIIIILTAILVLIGGAYSLLKDDDQKAEKTTSNSSQDNQSSTKDADSATIVFDGSAFSPEILNVKVGDTITVKNESSRTIQFESDPHPAHTDNTDLNIDMIKSGQSKSFVITLTGTFGYHDHLNPSATGTLVVK